MVSGIHADRMTPRCALLRLPGLRLPDGDPTGERNIVLLRTVLEAKENRMIQGYAVHEPGGKLHRFEYDPGDLGPG